MKAGAKIRIKMERRRENRRSWWIGRKDCRRHEEERRRREATKAGEGMGEDMGEGTGGEGQLCSGKGWEIEG